ncbi:MAG: aminotransferase class IV [candidate division Zixibacteria bacterium]
MRELKTVTTINGKLTSRRQAKVSVFDNALLYADGLFETFLAVSDQVIFIDEHLDRLYRGAKVIGIEPPVKREKLAEWMVTTVKSHPAKVKKLRLTITSGESARWVGKPGKPQVILSASPHELPKRPYKIAVSDLRVDQGSIFRRIKTLSYAIHAASLKRARAARCDDALLLNRRGRVAEITSANIFWVRKNIIYTPPLSSGCLEGVTRRITINEARGLGFSLREKQETLKQLMTSDECFLTSSLKLVTPVTKIVSGETTTTFPTGPVTKLLRRHIRRQLDLS